MYCPDMGELPLHVFSKIAWNQCVSIFPPLTVEYEQVAAFEVDVFHAKREGFIDSQTAPIKKRGNEPILRFHVAENRSDFVGAQNGRHAPRRFRHLVL